MASHYTASDTDDDGQDLRAAFGGGGLPGGGSINQKYIAGGGFCGLILLVVLLGSFQGLHATQYALTRNKYTGVVHFEPMYKGGRNLIGFWNTYVEFPATLQTLEWLRGPPIQAGTRDLSPFQVRTKDGLMIQLGMVAKYQIVEDKIGDMYRIYKEGVEGFFISNLRSELQESVANFRATQLYEDRLEVAEALTKSCQKVCKENLHGFLTCWRIDLLDVELDQKIEQQNIREQVEKERQRTERMKQNASLIRTSSAVIASDFDRQIKVVDAQARAAAYNLTAEAKANAQKMKQAARASSMQVIQDTMQDGTVSMSQSQLLQYLEKLAIMENPRGQMMYGHFQSASIFMKGGDEL